MSIRVEIGTTIVFVEQNLDTFWPCGALLVMRKGGSHHPVEDDMMRSMFAPSSYMMAAAGQVVGESYRNERGKSLCCGEAFQKPLQLLVDLCVAWMMYLPDVRRE